MGLKSRIGDTGTYFDSDKIRPIMGLKFWPQINIRQNILIKSDL